MKQNQGSKPKYQPPRQSFFQHMQEKMFFSFYIGKVKIQFEAQGATIWKFGVTIYPQYRQFELNFGRYLLNFWYRKDISNPWWRIQ